MSTKAINPNTGAVEWIPDVAGCSLAEPATGPITQAFGVTSVTGIAHRGLDVSIPSGTPVKAADRGMTIFTFERGYDAPGLASDGSPGGYGNQVRIAHGFGSTRYGHLTSVIVGVGQRVEAGQVIGYSGTTGISTGPHLHWEARTVDDWAFDPVGYIGAAPVKPDPGEGSDELAELSTDQQKELAKLVKLDVKGGNRIPNLLVVAASAAEGGFTAAEDAPPTNDPESRAIRRAGVLFAMLQLNEAELAAMPDGPAKDLVLDLINAGSHLP